VLAGSDDQKPFAEREDFGGKGNPRLSGNMREFGTGRTRAELLPIADTDKKIKKEGFRP